MSVLPVATRQISVVNAGQLFAGNSQNAEGVCSLDGLAVPDQEASVPRGFGEKILSFGAGDVAVTPRLGSRHPAAAAAAAATGGGGSLSDKVPNT